MSINQTTPSLQPQRNGAPKVCVKVCEGLRKSSTLTRFEYNVYAWRYESRQLNGQRQMATSERLKSEEVPDKKLSKAGCLQSGARFRPNALLKVKETFRTGNRRPEGYPARGLIVNQSLGGHPSGKPVRPGNRAGCGRGFSSERHFN